MKVTDAGIIADDVLAIWIGRIEDIAFGSGSLITLGREKYSGYYGRVPSKNQAGGGISPPPAIRGAFRCVWFIPQLLRSRACLARVLAFPSRSTRIRGQKHAQDRTKSRSRSSASNLARRN